MEADLVESRNLLRQIRPRPELARTYLSLHRLYDRAAQRAWDVDCHLRATSIFKELGMTDELRAAQALTARCRWAWRCVARMREAKREPLYKVGTRLVTASVAYGYGRCEATTSTQEVMPHGSAD